GRLFDILGSGLAPTGEARATPADGSSWLAYLRLRVAASTDDLTELLRALVGLEQKSPYARALRYLVKAWRVRKFPRLSDEHPPGSGEEEEVEALDFLGRFDLGYELRQHTFVQRQIQEKLRRDHELPQEVADQLLQLKRTLNDIYKTHLSDRVQG